MSITIECIKNNHIDEHNKSYTDSEKKAEEKGDWIVMKDVVLNEVIDEKIYQKFKKEIGKKDDYLNIEEYKKLLKKLT